MGHRSHEDPYKMLRESESTLNYNKKCVNARKSVVRDEYKLKH